MTLLSTFTARARARRLFAAMTTSALLLGSVTLPAAADEALADLVEDVAPSVVTILAEQERVAPAGHRNSGQAPFEEFFRQFQGPRGFKHDGPKQGLGSGFILQADGMIVTNHHVIDGADTITVQLADGRRFTAELVGSDPQTDLALLQIEADGLPFVELGNSDDIRVGEDVVAVGNPFGLGGTVTSGIVSAKSRSIGTGPYADFLQTDAAINKGNSGGPLFNMEGEVVGVNSAIYSPTGGSVGLGFAVTSNIVGQIVEDLGDDGKVDRGWLGVSIQNVTPEIAAAIGLEDATGALVSEVVDGSPADGKLKTGDVILAVNGETIEDSAELPKRVGAIKAGEKAAFGLLRGGEERTVQLKIGAYQTASADMGKDAEAKPAKMLGVTVAPLDEGIRSRIGVDGDVKGVVVTSIASASPASRAGLRVGDVIMRLGDTSVTNPDELRSALHADSEQATLLLINRSGRQVFVAVDFA